MSEDRADLEYDRPSQYSKEDLEKVGFIEPEPGKRPKPKGSIKFRLNYSTIETVETPDNPELNIIIKPFCKTNSLAGEAILSSGLIPSSRKKSTQSQEKPIKD